MNRFISGRSPFDNIITLQEFAHSINRAFRHPRGCLIKIDIEKAYYTLSWNAILATLTKMNFPRVWVNWIHACISSASFSFLINKQPSAWIHSSRGIRQGDPISSYLFILVSQNLSSMLNFSLSNHIISGFQSDLQLNFNQLIYGDDLILITLANRKVAWNINLCLSICHWLTGKSTNMFKSEIIFPDRFNIRLKRSISKILSFKLGALHLPWSNYLAQKAGPFPFSSFFGW